MDALMDPTFESKFKVQFDELKQSMNSCNSAIGNFLKRIVNLENKNGALEEYCRRNNLCVTGLKESTGESTDDLVIQSFQNKLGI